MMKWYENVDMLKEILENISKELEEVEYGSRVWYLLTDENNLIKNHLELIKENQELKEENKVLEACIKDWEDDYEHLEFYFKNREKALEIIKSKNVDTFYLAYCFNCGGLERYNRHAQKYHIGTLKKQEFDLLKEVFCND